MDGFIYADMHTQIAVIAKESFCNYSIGGGSVYGSVCIEHTCLKKIGTVVWESSLAFVSKVSEVNSLENTHKRSTCTCIVKISLLLLEHTR